MVIMRARRTPLDSDRRPDASASSQGDLNSYRGDTYFTPLDWLASSSVGRSWLKNQLQQVL